MRLAVANYALHAHRTAALLGSCGPLTIGQLALADLLRQVVTGAEAVHTALRGSAADLAAALRRLACDVAAVGELLAREESV
jgi:hypothetical protein